jgi:hypothetical protein
LRQFEHAGHRWRAKRTGAVTGLALGKLPAITSHGVTFDCVSAKNQPTVIGWIYARDLGYVSDDELKASLARALSQDAP